MRFHNLQTLVSKFQENRFHHRQLHCVPRVRRRIYFLQEASQMWICEQALDCVRILELVESFWRDGVNRGENVNTAGSFIFYNFLDLVLRLFALSIVLVSFETKERAAKILKRIKF